MAVYIVGLLSGFGLGWLSHIWRSEHLRARRRGGYVKPPASSSTNPVTDAAQRISFSSSPRLGLASVDAVGPVTQDGTSSISAPIVFGSVKVGDRGQPQESAGSGDAA